MSLTAICVALKYTVRSKPAFALAGCCTQQHRTFGSIKNCIRAHRLLPSRSQQCQLQHMVQKYLRRFSIIVIFGYPTIILMMMWWWWATNATILSPSIIIDIYQFHCHCKKFNLDTDGDVQYYSVGWPPSMPPYDAQMSDERSFSTGSADPSVSEFYKPNFSTYNFMGKIFTVVVE